MNWRNDDETLLAWWQLVGADRDGPGVTGSVDTKLGVRWAPASDWSLSVQYAQNLEPLVESDHRIGSLALQIRYLF